MRKRSIKKFVPGLILLCAMQAAPAQDIAKNAAMYYWKSIGLMQSPATPDQLEVIEFIENELPALPPRVLAPYPEALRALVSGRPMLAALEQASEYGPCAFGVYDNGGISPDLLHLPRMRDLTRRALATAKAYEFVDNQAGAGEIYANLLIMVQHLDQDHTLYSCAAAGELMQIILGNLEGFISRQPSLAVFNKLSRVFREAPERILHPADALREERLRYTDWLLTDPDVAMDRLSALYGNREIKPAVDKLITLDNPDKERKLRLWLNEYRDWMNQLAEAFEEPYAEGVPVIQRLDAQRADILKDETGGDNPLIPLLVPECTELYQRLLLAEAHFDMADLLCLVGEYRAETQSWPDRLSDLTPMGFRVMPKDPFTGKWFYYKLSRGWPVLIVRIPKWMASRKQFLYEIDLRSRRADDDQLGERTIKEIQKRRVRELSESVPME